MGAGFLLISTAAQQALKASTWHDNWAFGMTAFVALYTVGQNRRFPFALVLVILGTLLTAAYMLHNGDRLPTIGFHGFTLLIPSYQDFERGFNSAAGQIPLTVLNSIIAVHYLCEDLLPERPVPSILSLGVSVGMMNMVGCWFGAMPVCHGSGGLAAQYRFGARSGASIIFLGLIKLLLGIFFGSSLEPLFDAFPHAFLGVMVFAAGMELVNVGKDLNTTAKDLEPRRDPQRAAEADDAASDVFVLSEQTKNDRWVVMMATTGSMIAFRNALVGFSVGCGIWVLLKIMKWRNTQQETGGGRLRI
jgi:hypothetical protein